MYRKLRRAKNFTAEASWCTGSELSTNFTDIGASNSILRMSSEQILKEQAVLLPSHAYSSGDITILADQQSIQVLLDQEDSRLPEEKGKGYGWKIKPKLFFQKHLKLKKKTRADTLVAHSFSDLTSNLIAKRSKGSLGDLANLHLTPRKKPKSTGGSSMTNVLVRSVMVAPFVMSGLDKIVEHDTPLPIRSPNNMKQIPCISIESINEPQDLMDKNRATSIMSITSISTGSVSSLSTGEDDDEGNTTSATTSGFATSEPETVSHDDVLQRHSSLFINFNSLGEHGC